MWYSGRRCGKTRTCHGPCAGNCKMVRVSPSLPGQSGQGSAGNSAWPVWPTTTQLRGIGSLRSSMDSVWPKEPNFYTAVRGLEQADSEAGGQFDFFFNRMSSHKKKA